MFPFIDLRGFLESIRSQPLRPDSELLDPYGFVKLCTMNYDECWFQGLMPSIATVQKNKMYVAPVELKRPILTTDDIYVFDVIRKRSLREPRHVRPTPCSPYLVLILADTGYSTVMHTHSIHANMIGSLLRIPYIEFTFKEFPGNENDPDAPLQTNYLQIPIINGSLQFEELFVNMRRAIHSDPRYPALIIRGYGVFVWGKTWEETQLRYRAIEVLLGTAVEFLEKAEELVFWPGQEGAPPIPHLYALIKAADFDLRSE